MEDNHHETHESHETESPEGFSFQVYFRVIRVFRGVLRLIYQQWHAPACANRTHLALHGWVQTTTLPFSALRGRRVVELDA